MRKGVPHEHRALIWMVTSGAQVQLEKNPGYYQSLLGAQHDPKLEATICTGERVLQSSQKNEGDMIMLLVLLRFLLDLNRTFPDNIQFRKTSSPCLLKPLYNVLLAYGLHNPAVGYCQVTSVCSTAPYEPLWSLRKQSPLVPRLCPFYCSIVQSEHKSTFKPLHTFIEI